MERAAKLFNCKFEQLVKKTERDPFNPGNTIEAFICYQDGPFFGSLFFSKINGQAYQEVITSVPQVNSIEKMNFESLDELNNKNQSALRFYVSNKWDGININVFKYSAFGKVFLSLNTKGGLFLNNEGQNFDLFQFILDYLQVSNEFQTSNLQSKLWQIFPILHEDLVQSVSYELIGRKIPHLVKYDFDNLLYPLFITKKDGSIIPQNLFGIDNRGEMTGEFSSFLQDKNSVLYGECGPFKWNQNYLNHFITEFKQISLILNEEYRTINRLGSGYLLENFICEGKVIYLLNQQNHLISRSSIYKLRSLDIERNKFYIFNISFQTLALNTVFNLRSNQMELNQNNLIQEMKISPHTWNKFSTDIIKLTSDIPSPLTNSFKAKPKMLILIGLPGSGKSTFANKLTDIGWVRVNQDELGTRKKCESIVTNGLNQGKSVVVDRCNFDYEQRHHFVALAYHSKISDIRCLWIDTPSEICKSRVCVRKNHPTIPEGNKGIEIIDKFESSMVPPIHEEGFYKILHVQTESQLDSAIEEFRNLLLID